MVSRQWNRYGIITLFTPSQIRVQRGLTPGERDGGPVVVGAARARHALHLPPATKRGPQQVLVPGELGEQRGALTRLARIGARVRVFGLGLGLALGLGLGLGLGFWGWG